MSDGARNVDPVETARFSELAATWWDPRGSSRPLHLINAVRLQYVRARAGLEGRAVLDVGCGAGLLSEAMAAAGARVSAIDASPELIQVARLHLHESGLRVTYEEATAEEWSADHAGRYDVVTCMELIEHVPDPASLVAACARALRPGGHLFLSTINRTPKAWLLAVVAAEYVLRLLPKGTHDYSKLVRPSELDAWARAAGLAMVDISGLRFNPMTERFSRVRDVAVNYIAHLVRDDDAR